VRVPAQVSVLAWVSKVAELRVGAAAGAGGKAAANWRVLP